MTQTAQTDNTVKHIFVRLLAAMDRQEEDIHRDVNVEPLHQFRVALRRTRTLLGQMKGMFPQSTRSKFKREFAWVGRKTSTTRDIDVYLLFLDATKGHLLPYEQDALIALYQYLHACRQKEYCSMIKALNSKRYKTLKKNWKYFLEKKKRVTLNFGKEAIIHTASECIWRVYKKLLKMGRKINSNSPPKTLHALRKTAKKLRYLLEFFQALYPPQKIGKMIKKLKCLQDVLGKFQDLQVQQEQSRQFILRMNKENGLAPQTRNVMHSLINEAERESHIVRAAFKDEFKKFIAKQNHTLYNMVLTSKR